MAGAYLRFARANRRFVGFGIVMAFGSSFGQTYFIGVFGPRFQAEFALSHTAWGGIYMLGTLASALVLPFTGKLLDRVDLRLYTLVVCAALAAACALAASAWHPVVLVLAVFALRQSGQGLASHVASTSMARYFDAGRGRAIALATLGYSLGEACLPFLAVSAIGWFGWRATYAMAGAAQLLVIAPLALWLLRGHAERHAGYLARLRARVGGSTGTGDGWTRAQVLRDLRFYLIVPGALASSMILTGLFFHHLNIADAKGWSHQWITGSYVVYAVASVATSLGAGPLIDRYGALRLVPLMPLPLVCGLLILAAFEGPWAAWPYLIACGLATGLSYTALSAMWAELYGVEHLGAIRSLAFALGVFGSALGPLLMGAMLDADLSVAQVMLAFAVYTAAGGVLIARAVRMPILAPS